MKNYPNGRVEDFWPCQNKVFGITMFSSWNEIGSLLRLIDDNNIRKVFEFGIKKGEFSSFLVMKAVYESDFWFYGLTNNRSNVESCVLGVASGTSRANILPIEPEINNCLESWKLDTPSLFFIGETIPVAQAKTMHSIVGKDDILVLRGMGSDLSSKDLVYFSHRLDTITEAHLHRTRLYAYRGKDEQKTTQES